MKLRLIILLYLLLPITAKSSLLFKPLFANPFEARNGAAYHFDEKKIRLDIGASFDFLKFNVAGNKANIGVDLFTFTRLRHEGNFKFPVETSDYFFGLNYTMKFNCRLPSELRFRLAHISSHLVDGFTNADNNFLREPIVYSREFFDVVFAQYIGNLRLYAGLNLLFSYIPKNSEILTPQFGFDYSRQLTKWLSFDAGMDFKLIGIDKIWVGTTVAQLGLTFWTSPGYGIFLGGYYYNGRSIHGQFYDEYDNYIGLGLQFIFF